MVGNYDTLLAAVLATTNIIKKHLLYKKIIIYLPNKDEGNQFILVAFFY